MLFFDESLHGQAWAVFARPLAIEQSFPVVVMHGYMPIACHFWA